MYELYVLACLLINPNECITLQDLYSPHNTIDKRLARAYEVSKDIPVYAPHYFPKSYKCLDIRKESSKIRI